jgi:release factor glutamine methyltransferase
LNVKADRSIAAALNRGTAQLAERAIQSPRRDAEVLLGHVIGLDRAGLIAYSDRMVSEDERSRFESSLRRREQYEPVSYIVGSQEFWSLDLAVDATVLIPRPETECLVEACLATVGTGFSGRIADIGTGSGAIAIALATELSAARLVATDQSSDALRTAARNVESHGFEKQITLRQGDLFAALHGERFHLIVSNPPYISNSDMATLARDIRDHEPHLALVAGPDGLDVIRRLVSEAADYLAPGGCLALEMGSQQGDSVTDLMSRSGFAKIAVRPDHGGRDRVVVGQRP